MLPNPRGSQHERALRAAVEHVTEQTASRGLGGSFIGIAGVKEQLRGM